jgi:(+)-trans-carveol dehydrogenase
MPGRVDGKVALITGAARGQGRSHAVRLAEEGADIIALDSLTSYDPQTCAYPMATQEDLDETVRLVEKTGRRIVARQADIRDFEGVDAVVAEGYAEFGRLDIVSSQAGICPPGKVLWEVPPNEWRDLLDVNLTGQWHTAKAAVPRMIGAGNGGSIIFTSSGAGLMGAEHIGSYTAAKHGVIGLMRTLAKEVAQYDIRVNAVCPGTVATDMTMNERIFKLFRPDLETPTQDDAIPVYQSLNVLPHPWIQPRDISNVILFLASDEAWHITSVALAADLGLTVA